MLHIDDDMNITLTRGDTAVLELTIKDDGATYDFSNDLVQLTIKRNTVTAEVLIQRTFTAGVVVINPADTAEMRYTNLKYDVQLIKENNGGVFTVIPPRLFTIAEEVNFNVTG